MRYVAKISREHFVASQTGTDP